MDHSVTVQCRYISVLRFLPRLVLGALWIPVPLYAKSLGARDLSFCKQRHRDPVTLFSGATPMWFSRVEEMPVTFSYLTAAVVSALITLLSFGLPKERS